MRPHIQRIDRNMRQAFSNVVGQTQSLSEGNAVPNTPEIKDQDEIHGNYDSNKSPHASTSSSPIVLRTINGDFTMHDTSVHRTNISSFNVEYNAITNSFNDDYSANSSGRCL